ncbi:MAG: hypothetical protein ABSG64_12405 [Solirubrobacteraceae bacterium]|jgi:hypothetical protein
MGITVGLDSPETVNPVTITYQDTTERSEFENFQRLASTLVHVPKAEIDAKRRED